MVEEEKPYTRPELLEKFPYPESEIEARKGDDRRSFIDVFPLVISERAAPEARAVMEAKMVDMGDGDIQIFGNAALAMPLVNEVPDAIDSVSVRRTTRKEQEEQFKKSKEEELNKKNEKREAYNDLKAIQLELQSKNMKIGGLLGLGSMGVVFELESYDKGERVESAILRIDPTELIGNVENPAALPLLFRVQKGHFTASVLPISKEMDSSLSKEERYELVKQSMAVLNSTNLGPRPDVERSDVITDKSSSPDDPDTFKVPVTRLGHYTHLDYTKDIHPDQFMMTEGVEGLPQLSDISSMNDTAVVRGAPGAGLKRLETIDDYIYNEVKAGNPEAVSIRTDVAPPEVVEKMHKQVEDLKERVYAEMESKGIRVTPSTVVRKAEIVEEVGKDKSHEHGAGVRV